MSDQLFSNGGTSGLYYLPPHRQSTVSTAAGKTGLRVLSADIISPATKDAVLSRLGTALAFPSWYGANFDALFDCLTDADWQPSKGHLILINGMAELRTSDPDSFATLIEVLQAAAESRQAANSPCWIAIDTPARGVPGLPEA